MTKLASVLYPKFLVGAFGKDATNQKKKLVVSCKSIFIQVFSVIVSILAKKNLPSESHDALYKLHRESDPTTTIRMIISKIEVFYEAKKFKEAGYMFNSLFSIVEYHQDAPDYIFDWLKQFLIDPPPGTHETDGDQIIAKKSMLLLSLLVHDPKNDFKLIGEIIVFMSTFSEIVGSQPTEQSSQDDTFELVNETTADVICSTLLNSMYGFYDDLEYIINLLLKSRKNDGTDGTDFKVYESKLYQQTTLLVYSLSKFERIHLKQATSDLRLKVVGKAYKTLTQLVKYKMIDSKPVISEEFADTLSHCHEMTQLLYVMLPFVTEKPESKKRKTDKVVVGRDTKLVPSVVFQVETFERYLIELSKKAEFDLEKFIRRSTARDFKIDLRGYHGGDDEDEKEKAENEEPKKKDKKKKK